MYKAEQLSCLSDAGHIKSIGRFVTQRLDAIEMGLCPFDGSFSGFRWHEETGWESIFVVRHNSNDPGIITICEWTEGNPYSEEEIALALEEFFASEAITRIGMRC